MEQTTGGEANYIEVEDLVVRYGEMTAVAGVSFTVRRGEHLTLLGPSGCGKTTTLRAIAGLEAPCGGEIRIDGEIIYSAAKKVTVPTEKRNLSMVFQSYAIWPHMTVLQNVAYGLRLRGLAKGERERRAWAALNLVQMSDFAERGAAKLSGGQQQRVALARALAVSPRVLLLDEPLSNLDARLRAAMRLEVQALQKQIGLTSIYVTHDQEEALVISDRIIVMNAGKIAQSGTPAEIYEQPRNAFVADFVGAANLIPGTVRADLGYDGMMALETDGKILVYGRHLGRATGEKAKIAVRAAYLKVSRAPSAEQVNNWPARVKQRAFLGDSLEYILDWDGREIVARCQTCDLFNDNEMVYLRADPGHCIFLEQEA